MSLLTTAVSAVVTDDAGRVLLCRRSQGSARWGLPGGRLRREESPAQAVLRDIRAETGIEIDLVDLVGLYHLTGAERPGGGTAPGIPAARAELRQPPPDVLVHVFRARARGAVATVDAPCPAGRLHWHDPGELPDPVTPITRTAIDDALAGRSGVLREVCREPEGGGTEPAAGATGLRRPTATLPG